MSRGMVPSFVEDSVRKRAQPLNGVTGDLGAGAGAERDDLGHPAETTANRVALQSSTGQRHQKGST